jgi:hypothetical protein
VTVPVVLVSNALNCVCLSICLAALRATTCDCPGCVGTPSGCCSTALVCALLGAAHGLSAIPTRWVEGLEDSERIVRTHVTCLLTSVY